MLSHIPLLSVLELFTIEGRGWGKICFRVVTGASTGIGRATAIRFAQDGANLAVSVYRRSVREVEQIAAELGRAMISVRADVRNSADVDSLVCSRVGS